MAAPSPSRQERNTLNIDVVEIKAENCFYGGINCPKNCDIALARYITNRYTSVMFNRWAAALLMFNRWVAVFAVSAFSLFFLGEYAVGCYFPRIKRTAVVLSWSISKICDTWFCRFFIPIVRQEELTGPGSVPPHVAYITWDNVTAAGSRHAQKPVRLTIMYGSRPCATHPMFAPRYPAAPLVPVLLPILPLSRF